MNDTPTPRCDALEDQLRHDPEASRDFELVCFSDLARDLERQLAELTDRWERAANAYLIERGKHEETQRQLAEATRNNVSAAKSKAFDQIMAWDHGDPSAPKAIRPVFMPQGFHNKPTHPID